MKGAIMVLYDDHNGGRQNAGLENDIEWINKGMLARGRTAKLIPFDREHPEEVKLALADMVRFVAGRFDNNGHLREDMVNPEEEKFWKSVKRQLGPVIREGLKEVWYGKKSDNTESSKPASSA